MGPPWAARRGGGEDDGPKKQVSGVAQKGGGKHLHGTAPGGWGGDN